MSSMISTFGPYATQKQVNYICEIVMGRSEVFTKGECDSFLDMMARLNDDEKINIDDYIRQINFKLKEKADNGSAEALYWLGMYEYNFGEGNDRKQKVLAFFEKSAEMGCEDAKKMLKKTKKWS